MNDPNDAHTDPQRSPANLTDEEIQAFIERVRAADGRRHYLSARNPEDNERDLR